LPVREIGDFSRPAGGERAAPFRAPRDRRFQSGAVAAHWSSGMAARCRDGAPESQPALARREIGDFSRPAGVIATGIAARFVRREIGDFSRPRRNRSSRDRRSQSRDRSALS
jgi:hypothetical protein